MSLKQLKKLVDRIVKYLNGEATVILFWLIR